MKERIENVYKNESQDFVIEPMESLKQYNHIYQYRLQHMTPLLHKLINERYGNKYSVIKLADLKSSYDGLCILIGSLYKHQSYKPSILRDLADANQFAPQPQREKYADNEDKVMLEDQVQRLQLFGEVDAGKVATGVICAVLGSLEHNGRFSVKDILYYESGPQLPISPLTKNTRGKLVLLSGLNLLEKYDTLSDSLNMLQHWLVGNIGKQLDKPLTRVVIAGNAINTTSKHSDYDKLATAFKHLDNMLAAWSKSIAVDIMPGLYDPANVMLPQQAFQRFMFPCASEKRYFQSVTNPYRFILDDVSIVGCSGQNVKDLLRSTAMENELDALRNTLIFSHIAPTAPDTLPCVPLQEKDPLLLLECPHIYFAGNCEMFATEMHSGSAGQKTRIICVPSFELTNTIAVVDLDTLDCNEIAFNSS